MGSSASRMDGSPADARSHGHALLLAARKLARDSAATRCAMPTRSSDSHHAHLALRCGHHSAVRKRQFDVLIHGQIADQIEALEDEADLAVADA